MKRAALTVAVFLALSAPASAQVPLMLNPGGDIGFDCSDHARLTEYRVGWFRLDTDAEPAVAETVPVGAITVPSPGATTGLTFRLRTRPPFARYVLRMKAVAGAPCTPTPELPCESGWSDAGTWTQAAISGVWIGYVPNRPSAFIIR
jgi:hypothetical protein